MSEDNTTPFPTPESREVPDSNPPAEDAQQPGEDQPRELTIEEKIPHMEAALRDLFQRFNLVLGLLQALGEHKGMKLKQRQAGPNGQIQFYWQAEGGRIVLPNGRN